MVFICVPRVILKEILEKLEIIVDFETNSYYFCRVKWLAEIIQENVNCQNIFNILKHTNDRMSNNALNELNGLSVQLIFTFCLLCVL